jgi:hypothetical protein
MQAIRIEIFVNLLSAAESRAISPPRHSKRKRRLAARLAHAPDPALSIKGKVGNAKDRRGRLGGPLSAPSRAIASGRGGLLLERPKRVKDLPSLRLVLQVYVSRGAGGFFAAPDRLDAGRADTCEQDAARILAIFGEVGGSFLGNCTSPTANVAAWVRRALSA